MNLALGKPAYTAPGTEYSGLNEGDHRSGCLQLTNQHWWVVDLQSEHQISQVVATRDCKSAIRLSDALNRNWPNLHSDHFH